MYSVLKMEALSFSETLITVYQSSDLLPLPWRRGWGYDVYLKYLRGYAVTQAGNFTEGKPFVCRASVVPIC
jgi:hypothetical protein